MAYTILPVVMKAFLDTRYDFICIGRWIVTPFNGFICNESRLTVVLHPFIPPPLRLFVIDTTSFLCDSVASLRRGNFIWSVAVISLDEMWMKFDTKKAFEHFQWIYEFQRRTKRTLAYKRTAKLLCSPLFLRLNYYAIYAKRALDCSFNLWEFRATVKMFIPNGKSKE